MTIWPLLHSLRGAGCALAGLSGFAVVSSALAAWSPCPNVPIVGAKLEHLRQQGRDFDTIFVGSSRVHCEIIPAVFDQVAGTRSFNVGIPGMFPPESLYLARRVLALRLPRLKWMFIELADLNPIVDLRNAGTARGVFWHDARHTWMACRDLWPSSRPVVRKIAATAEHLRLFVEHAANIGRGAALVAPRLASRARKEPSPLVTDAGGFLPVSTTLSGVQLRCIRTSLDELRSRAWPAIPLRPVYREALRDLVGEVRRAGIEPIFFRTPSFDWRDRLNGPGDAPLLSFLDEAHFSAFFDPQNYGDTVHLNERGATLFTTALAEQFTTGR